MNTVKKHLSFQVVLFLIAAFLSFNSISILSATKVFPKTPAGNRAKEILDLFNSGEAEKVKKYVKENFAPGFRDAFPMEQHVGMFSQIHTMRGQLELYEIKSSSKFKIDCSLFSSSTNSLLNIQIQVEETEPNLIARMGIRPGGAPVRSDKEGDKTLQTARKGQNNRSSRTESAWNIWRQSKIHEAATAVNSIINDEPGNSKARHLQIITSFVMGKYKECLSQYALLDKKYDRYNELSTVILEAYKHLNRLKKAAAFAKKTNQPELICAWLEKQSRIPMIVKLNKVTVIPFDKKHFLYEFMPAVPIELNGKSFLGHLDTGGSFLAMSPRTAESLNIDVAPVKEGIANFTKVMVSMGIVNKLKLGDAELTNVPVASIPSLTGQLENLVIIGTNILEQFLTTWDNDRERLILSPRGDDKTRNEHFNLIPGDQKEMDFYLHSDHYLFAHGGIGDFDLLYKVDTGLVTADSRGKQPAIEIAAEDISHFGFEEVVEERQFVDCPVPISLGLVEDTGHVILVRQKKTFLNFQGIEATGNLSFGFLKNFVWTLDFDNHKWFLSKAAKKRVEADRVTSDSEILNLYVGKYEVAPGMNLEVTSDGETLFLQAPGQQKVAMAQKSETTFVIKLANAKIVFGKDKSGEITYFILFQAGRETRANKVK